jgi:hypothetical protein
MLRGLLDVKGEKSQTFQVMLLENDVSDDVEVHETKEVDFLRIQEHLKQGGSVFITSKRAQKLVLPLSRKKNTSRRRNAMRTVTAFYFDHV